MRILIAVEDEFFGKCIIDFMQKLGWSKNVQIKLVHIVEPLLVDSYMSVAPAPILTEVVREHKVSAQKLLDKLEAELMPYLDGGTVEKSVFEDFPKSAILDEAKNWNADMIVMGSHGRKGFSKFFLGSVSQAVCTHSHIPVLVVRPSAEALGDKSTDAA